MSRVILVACLYGLFPAVFGKIGLGPFLVERFIENVAAEDNDRPIIGVLSQELTDKLIANYGNHSSFIAASNVKILEGAGARVVPIMIGQDETYYRDLLKYLNGVLIPGGSVWFDDKSNGYVAAGRLIREIADEANTDGTYFPVWGTCLGFELLAYLEQGAEIRVNCSAYNVSNPLLLSPESTKSRLFFDVPQDISDILKNRNSTSNFHHFCITPKDLAESKLAENWMVVSTSYDESGLEYVSTMEHYTFPYYASQWHPEKPLYEWGHFAIPHDRYSVKISQFVADFFVNEARKNSNKFPSEAVEREYLIYNFLPTYGQPTSTYSQLYFFDN